MEIAPTGAEAVPTVKEDPAPAPNVKLVAERVVRPVENRLTAEPVEKLTNGEVVLLKVTVPDAPGADTLKGPPPVLDIDPLMEIFPVGAVTEKAPVVPSVIGHKIATAVVFTAAAQVNETFPPPPPGAVVVVMDEFEGIFIDPVDIKTEAPGELLEKLPGAFQEKPVPETEREVPVKVELFI
jgi:hypothetical protein